MTDVNDDDDDTGTFGIRVFWKRHHTIKPATKAGAPPPQKDTLSGGNKKKEQDSSKQKEEDDWGLF